MDKVRRGEHKDLLAKGDDRLLGTRYPFGFAQGRLWLWHPDELTGAKLEAFEAAAWQNLRTARAYYHQMMFLEFWEPLGPELLAEGQPDVPAAQRYFAQWYAEAMRSALAPIKKVARTLRDHLHGLLSYFRHRITHALCEAFNASIQALKATARGFRSFEHYRTRILFFLGKLNLHPL